MEKQGGIRGALGRLTLIALIVGAAVSATRAETVVTITSPTAGETVSGTVNIVTQVVQPPLIWENFYIDGNKIASSPPYTIPWNTSTLPSGSHTIEVDAFDGHGKTIGVAKVTVAVANPSPPASSVYFGTLAPHASLPSESQCAELVTPSAWEPRPENAVANHTVPTAQELASFYAAPLNFISGPPASDFQAVDGNYTGTTDMILRWAACKWGMDENQLRAQAYDESWWSAYTTGDLRTDQSQCQAGNWNGWQPQGYCYQSYGLLQMKMASYNAWPMAWDYTAFNADFRGAYWRACMNGDVAYYYDDVPQTGYPTYPNGSVDQMAWGCIGSWYSGSWYDAGAISYIGDIQAINAAKPWLTLPASSSPSLTLQQPGNGATVSGQVQIAITLDQSDPKACYACWSIDGIHQSCTPAVGPWTWDTTNHVLNGHHAIQVDSYTCEDAGPNYHAAVDVNVSN